MSGKVNLKKILKYVWIIYAVLSIGLVLFLIDMLICKDIKVSNRYILDKGWNVTINDKYYENVDFDNFRFKSVGKNDFVVLEKIIPDDYEFEQAVLTFFSRHAAMSLYVDDELKYEYGFDRYIANKSTGSGYQFINFNDEYKGKNLRIEFLVTENQGFSKIEIPWLSEWKNTYRYIITENRIPLMVGIFLMVLGVVMTCVLVFSVTISIKYSNVLLLALFSICIGLWTLCYYNVFLIFSIPIYSITLMQYMSLFIAPVPMTAYMRAYVNAINLKYVTVIHNILFFAQLGLTTISILLHTFDIMHAAETLLFFHIMFVVHMTFFVYVISCNMRKNTTLSKISTIGMMIVAICIFYELLEYVIPKYIGYKVPQIKGIASIGVIMFIGILIIDLYLDITKNMMEKQERELLVRLAYTDELTKLYNRTYCSECLQLLSESEKSSNNYAIINLDLNGLKKINDTYGHAKGDRLICAAASVIKKSFSSDGVVGRMGGDEFIAIIGTSDVEHIEKLIEKFVLNIQEANKENPDLGLSISYGYAANNEVEGNDYKDVYEIADERMYAYKQNVKK